MRNHRNFILCKLLFVGCAVSFMTCNAPVKQPGWPQVTTESKPWTRWWWHGNALTKEGITTELEAYKKAGLGGVEITPIYGVYGYEDRFINYLSPQWMELLSHTLREGERLGLGIDMATGTGWPFGGPWIDAEHACKNLQYKVYSLSAGERLPEKIEFIQPPYVRAVGNQVYEVHDGAAAEKRFVAGTRKEPQIKAEARALMITDLLEPVSANKNLQALALDQVQFEKPLKLQALMAYSETGEHIDLTSKVNENGLLEWTAPAGRWKLYAIFQGWHGKMVERAGPGGEGNVIDHFSKEALQTYLHHFDSAFKSTDITSLRSFFNDSYEVDDARGSADWTPLLFKEFKKRRGYDLRDHLDALFGEASMEKNEGVLSDYRETISELLLDNFTTPWKAWAHSKSALVRNQAHGSPANILDLYATVDIPEIEGIEPLRIKMASSAGNVTGKKLVSSESATWLNEHFHSSLSDIKMAVDRFLLNGVNHVFYHGTAYSPPEEPWPGWLFYAAVHLNPRNPMWKDFDALNEYVARCQSFLQNTVSDNDVLLYYPIYDRFAFHGAEMIEHFDGIGRQFENTPFAEAAGRMLARGYTFDYISDKQIRNLTVNDQHLKTEGGAFYKTLVVPQCRYMPVETLKQLEQLADRGARIIFYGDYPLLPSGFANIEDKERDFMQIIERLKKRSSAVGANNDASVLSSDSLHAVLAQTGIRRERMVDHGIHFIRKKDSDGNGLYLINNTNRESFEGWLPLRSAKGMVIYDPMKGTFGKAKLRSASTGETEVFVQLMPGQSLIIQQYEAVPECADFLYHRQAGESVILKGPWHITFEEGGPTLPAEVRSDTLLPWTALGDEYKAFSGVATYHTSFTKPASDATGWLLDLGPVKGSVEVILNDDTIATLIGPAFMVYIDSSSIKESNTLNIRVSNLMTNRIIYMERNQRFWKKFYNVNFPSRQAENRVNGLFFAGHWLPVESGLKGNVQIIPQKQF